MIWIDLENKRPTDVDIPGWTPWSQEQWNAWLVKSKQLVEELAKLQVAGKRDERNALIDANSAHWTELKPWLQALSAGKCWFSEVRELYSHYDVEHFRPKKVAKALDGTDRDGYWWLAFNYMNFRLCGNVGNRKKGGWFPLQAGSPCSTFAHQCEETESAYLLDPVDIEDVKLLTFDEEGKAVPRPGASDWEKRRVVETVARLKLNEHAALAEERRKVWARVSECIAAYQAAVERYRSGGNEVAKQKAKEAAKRIRDMASSTAELSAVAKWCVLFRNEALLSQLIA